MRQLIAGNWKMHGLKSALAEIDRLASGLAAAPVAADVVVCPPATLLAAAAARPAAARIAFGGQDCHARTAGPHTGDISAEMLRDAGATFVIVGHSERRQDHGETDAAVRAKAEAARAAGLTPILCVGETAQARAAGAAEETVARQLAGSLPEPAREGLVIAYEPVWAIGTGLTPSPAEIADMHAFIRARIGPGARILYGGSVKALNAREILGIRNVDGALVGGASLNAEEFLAIIAAAERRE